MYIKTLRTSSSTVYLSVMLVHAIASSAQSDGRRHGEICSHPFSQAKLRNPFDPLVKESLSLLDLNKCYVQNLHSIADLRYKVPRRL